MGSNTSSFKFASTTLTLAKHPLPTTVLSSDSFPPLLHVFTSMGSSAGNTRVNTNCTSSAVHVSFSVGKFTFRMTPEGSRGGEAAGCAKSALTTLVVNSAFESVLRMLEEVGAEVRSVNDSCCVPVPENAIDGIPSFAPSQAAPLSFAYSQSA